MRYLRGTKGFTLIEVLIALAVFSVLGMMTTVILVGALQGAKKAAAVALVKNEGARVINTMTQMLKYSPSVTACTTNPYSITFQPRVGDRDLTRFFCTSDSIASNSATAELTSGKVEMTTCSITCPSLQQVNIEFKLRMKVGSFATENADTTFKTQIGLRNQVQ